MAKRKGNNHGRPKTKKERKKKKEKKEHKKKLKAKNQPGYAGRGKYISP